MKAGEVAAASGCHIETIRYYERIGLLPRPARTQAGYRTYGPDDVGRLRFITRGRELGFSLDEIRSLLSLAEDPKLRCADVDQLARRHLVDIEERIRELRRIARVLETTIRSCVGGTRGSCAILGTLQQRAGVADVAPGDARRKRAPRRHA